MEDISEFLRETDCIDFSNPLIVQKADELKAASSDEVDYIERAYRFVRDEIPHSWDARLTVVSKKASDVLKNGTGICWTKSCLLAALLSDNSHFVQRVAIFAGKSKTAPLLSVREFGLQCMLYTLDEVLRYADVLNIIQADERNRIVERKETALFENDAFREAMINAFVHNRWVDGNEPMISVFSDRIEILSRGPIPPEQTLEGFFAGVSIPVNQKLSEIFLQLHISEKTGRGVPKVVEKYNKSVYSFNENYIVVTIPFRWINSVGWNVEQLENCTVKSEKFGVNDEKFGVNDEKFGVNEKTWVKILNLIQNNPSISALEISSILGLSTRAIEKQIKNLKDNNKIIRVGSDKTGHWEIISKGDTDDR